MAIMWPIYHDADQDSSTIEPSLLEAVACIVLPGLAVVEHRSLVTTAPPKIDRGEEQYIDCERLCAGRKARMQESVIYEEERH